MLISETVQVKWNAKIKKHYVDKGYVFTKMCDTFDVLVSDLTKGSNVMVEVACDYCGEHYLKCWHRYISEKLDGCVQKDCCYLCKARKIVEVSNIKYGVNSVLLLDDVQEKIHNTNIQEYGTANPFASETIKQRITTTNLERYGTAHPMKNADIKKKAETTNIARYGVSTPLLLNIKYGKDNPRWKGGLRTERTERMTNEYHQWRKNVFQRDHFICQCCGQSSSHLQARHVLNWNDNIEQRYDVENGITLCKVCHT